MSRFPFTAPDIDECSPTRIRDELARTSDPLDLDQIESVHRVAARVQGSDPALAMEIARSLLRLVPDDSRARVIAHRALAEASIYTGQWVAALGAYDDAITFAETGGHDDLLGQILVGRIGVLAATGETDDIPRLTEQAEAILRRTDDAQYLAKLYVNLGNSAFHGERHDEAYDLYARALTTFGEAGIQDHTWVAVLANQAVACHNTGRIDQARELVSRAEQRAGELGLHRFRAQVLFNGSNIERDSGNYRAALNLTREGETELAQVEAADVAAGARLNQTDMLIELGLYGEAAGLAQDTARAFDELHMAIDAAIARSHEARAHLGLGDAPSALAAVAAAEPTFRALGAWPRLAWLRLSEGRARASRGETALAIHRVRVALRVFRRLRMSRHAAAARAALIDLYLEDGQVEPAAAISSTLLDQVEALSPSERAAAYHRSARAGRAGGSVDLASQQFRTAVESVEEQRRLVPSLELRAALFREHAPIYHDFVDHLDDTPGSAVEEVLRVIEAARGRAFDDRQHMPADVQAKLAQDRTRLGAMYRRRDTLELGEPSDDRDAELADMKQRIQATERSIVHILRTIDPEDADVPLEATVGQIQSGMDDDECLVEYFVTSTRVLALVITSEFADLIRLPSSPEVVRHDLKGLIHMLETMMASVGVPFGSLDFLSTAADTLLTELHDHLLKPVEAAIADKRRLLIVPHAFLHRVPFECLRSEEGYAIDRWSIRRIPTARSLIRDLEPTPPRSEPLVAGAVTNGPDLVETELGVVASALGVSYTADPTSADLLAALPAAGHVHLATHGVFRSDNTAFSQLVTADGGLFLSDLLGLKLGADLVVLSACDTGRVESGAGDDLTGIAHAFLAAGCRRVMASQWRVHDEATVDLMTTFYESLRESPGDVSAALARASRETRDRWDHPFYWGAFAVHGA